MYFPLNKMDHFKKRQKYINIEFYLKFIAGVNQRGLTL